MPSPLKITPPATLPPRISWPVMILAPRPAVPVGATEAERKAIADLDSMITLAMRDEGHGAHGWDTEDGAAVCRCGGLAFRLDTIGAASA